jgi:branched-chain amino acid aminotransferase
MYFFINGNYVTEKEATLSVLDLGLIRGYGIFDYLRTYQGQPFHLEEHLERFLYSAKTTKIQLPYSLEEIKEIVFELLKKGNYPESSIKILATGGVSPDQMLPQGPGSLIAYVYPLKPYPLILYTHGIKAITTDHQRTVKDCKTLQYLPAILSLQEGKQQGALESLYLSTKREILEATTSNFFGIKKGTLITPPIEEILVGITREVVLRLCQKDIPIEVRPIPYDEIKELDEAFVTASNKEIMPVVQIDGQVIGTGNVGGMTLEIQKRFALYTKQNSWEPLFIPRYSNSSVEKYLSTRSGKTVTT